MRLEELIHGPFLNLADDILYNIVVVASNCDVLGWEGRMRLPSFSSRALFFQHFFEFLDMALYYDPFHGICRKNMGSCYVIW